MKLKRGILAFLASLIVVISFAFAGAFSYDVCAEEANSDVVRIYGSTRYETSLKVADELKNRLGVDQFDAVILADGRNYPDALAGSCLSCAFDAPIILVNTNNTDITKAAQDYIKKNLNAEKGVIYILGGTGVVSDSVKAGMNGYAFKRLAGADRYKTDIEILKAGPADKEIVVCTGTNYADSLSAAALGKPILLVKGSLQDSQKQYLESTGKENTFYIIGGEGAVNANVEKELKAYGTTERVFGADRYATSASVARKFFATTEAGVLAYGNNFPDGLCGGALAYSMDGPLLLVKDGKIQEAKSYAEETGMWRGAILGGPALISDESEEEVFQKEEGYITYNGEKLYDSVIASCLNDEGNAPLAAVLSAAGIEASGNCYYEFKASDGFNAKLRASWLNDMLLFDNDGDPDNGSYSWRNSLTQERISAEGIQGGWYKITNLATITTGDHEYGEDHTCTNDISVGRGAYEPCGTEEL